LRSRMAAYASAPRITCSVKPPNRPGSVTVFLDQLSGKVTDICDICLDGYSIGQDFALSSCCNLRTHAECLATWLRTSSQPVRVFHGASEPKTEPQSTCPKCRRSMRSNPFEYTFKSRALEFRESDSVDVTVRHLMFQDQVDHYFRQSARHCEISRQLWRLSEPRWSRSWSWIRWREFGKEERQKTKNCRWLSDEHKRLGRVYLGYARDWVALSEPVPL
jgi:hypothetical protein